MKTKPLTPEVMPKVGEAESLATSLTTRVTSLSEGLITRPKTKDEAEEANTQFLQLKAVEKELGEKKKGLLNPLKTLTQRVKELFEPAETKLTLAINQVRNGLTDFNREAQAKLDAKKESLAERVQEEVITETSAIRREVKYAEKIGVGAVKTRKIKKLIITNEKLIPRKFLTIDEPAVKKAILDGEFVPGAEVVEEEIVVM